MKNINLNQINKNKEKDNKVKKILKNKKGITLIALVITIIILLILAGVSIATLTGDNGILTKAQDASDATIVAQIEEEINLWKMEKTIYDLTGEGSPLSEDDFINSLINNGLIVNDDYDSITGKIIVNGVQIELIETITESVAGIIQTEKVIYIDINNKIAPIPAGFMISTVSTEQNIDTGLTIIDENNNEFVWVPVEDTSIMYEIDTTTSEYKGIIYLQNSYVLENGIVTVDKGTSYTEPTKQISYPETIEEEYQAEFDEMIESVETNGGFYIGRYEMGIDSSLNATSIKGSEVYTASSYQANGWNGLYTTAKTYINGEITSQMIWGCQYDQMMIWMTQNGINVNTSTVEGTEKNTSETITGIEEGDKVNNIYDLLGRGYEWIQSAYSSNYRARRGGYYGYSNSLSNTYRSLAYEVSNVDSSRIILIL